jgi:hypothetical protein
MLAAMAGRAMQEMPGFQCRKNRASDAEKTELLMQENRSAHAGKREATATNQSSPLKGAPPQWHRSW